MSPRPSRIDQLLAGLGYGSRKDIDLMLKRGRIKVAGVEKPRGDLRVDASAITVDDEPLDHPEGLLVMLNKPCGYVCSRSEEEGPTVYEFFPERWNHRTPQLVTIGRLDKETSGLLLLTDQHELVHRLTSPKHHVPKTYEAVVDGDLSEASVARFASGELMLRGETKPCLPARMELLDRRRARVSVEEGRYHQVRRMFAAIEAPVLTLKRTHFGRLDLNGLEEGSHRLLPPLLTTVE